MGHRSTWLNENGDWPRLATEIPKQPDCQFSKTIKEDHRPCRSLREIHDLKLFLFFHDPIITKMRLVALISGGKDSCYNMLQCLAAGHEIVALAHLKPKHLIDELDSHMYQSVGHDAIEVYSKALNLPLYQGETEGLNLCKGKDYVQTSGDEVEDLYSLLQKVNEKENIQGVSVGAILSNYQRVRVENVCSRLGLTSFSYLWRRNQVELLSEMIATGTRAILIKVAALGLKPELHLGKDISEVFPHLLEMQKKYGLNVCGEGGEYETFTLDCPLFKEKIVIDEQETVVDSQDSFASVGYIKFKNIHLEQKLGIQTQSQQDRVKEAGICGPSYFLFDLDINYTVKSTVGSDLTCTKHTNLERHYSNSPCNFTKCKSGWFWVSECVASIEDSTEKMKQALQLLESELAAKELSMSDLVSIQLYVKDMSEFADLNSAYKLFFNLNPPSRVCVEVPLPDDVQFVMHTTGFKGPSENTNSSINHMHVQSISHWAPANIGPYSQAVQGEDFIYVAGQIGLIPTTMEMIGGGIVPESRLSLRHVLRVLQAMDASSSLENVLFCVCYVTGQQFITTAREEWNKVLKCGSVNKLVLNCVVVPGLPRGAQIEWQVVSHCKPQENWTWDFPAMKLIDEISIETTLGQFNAVGVMIARCYDSDPELTLAAVNSETLIQEETLSKAFTYLTKLMSQSHAATFHFQVYYAVMRTSWNHLQNAWKQVQLQNAGLSLIPVLNNETNTCVLCIFARFS